MRWIKGESESGTIALIVAILVSSSLVIGMFVIVADTGSLFSERRVIQNAADAASLALVRECANLGNGVIDGVSSGYSGPICASPIDAKDFAQKYANLNSPDSLTDVIEVCGQSPLNSCSSNSGAIFDCKTVDPKYLNYIRVTTSTRTTQGTSIENVFSKILNQNDAGTTVPGCAQSAWGKSSFAPIFFPMALPICDYALGGTRIIKSFSSNDPVVTGGCTITDLNGVNFYYASPTKGFSLLANIGCPGVTSPQSVRVADVLTSEPSLLQVEKPCSDIGLNFYSQVSSFINVTLFVPVVTSVICSSTSVNCQGSYQFEVASFFAFKLLGLRFKNSGLAGATPACPTNETCGSSTNYWPSYCDSTAFCVYGTFERAAAPGADVSTDPNFPSIGAQAIQLLP